MQLQKRSFSLLVIGVVIVMSFFLFCRGFRLSFSLLVIGVVIVILVRDAELRYTKDFQSPSNWSSYCNFI